MEGGGSEGPLEAAETTAEAAVVLVQVTKAAEVAPAGGCLEVWE